MKQLFSQWLGDTAFSRGRRAEKQAESYLCKQGLQLVQRNYRCAAGEIDLIMVQNTLLVFVEVRYRQHQQFGGSLESVDSRKQQRVINAAKHYLQKHRCWQQHTCRFDVVLLSGTPVQPQLNWLSDAFRP